MNRQYLLTIFVRYKDIEDRMNSKNNLNFDMQFKNIRDE